MVFSFIYLFIFGNQRRFIFLFYWFYIYSHVYTLVGPPPPMSPTPHFQAEPNRLHAQSKYQVQPYLIYADPARTCGDQRSDLWLPSQTLSSAGVGQRATSSRTCICSSWLRLGALWNDNKPWYPSASVGKFTQETEKWGQTRSCVISCCIPSTYSNLWKELNEQLPTGWINANPIQMHQNLRCSSMEEDTWLWRQKTLKPRAASAQRKGCLLLFIGVWHGLPTNLTIWLL
jgi:hypothetical protein